MSKFCPDLACDFYEDFEDGLKGKKVKSCPSCSKLLVPEKPIEDVIDHDDPTIISIDNPGINSSENSGITVPSGACPSLMEVDNRENNQAHVPGNKVAYPELPETSNVQVDPMADNSVINKQPLFGTSHSSDISSLIRDAALPTNIQYTSIDQYQLNTSESHEHDQSSLPNPIATPGKNNDVESEENGSQLFEDASEILISDVEVTSPKDQVQLVNSLAEFHIPSIDDSLDSGSSSPVLPPPTISSRKEIPSENIKPISGKKRNPSEPDDDIIPRTQKSKFDSDSPNSQDGKPEIQQYQGDIVHSNPDATNSNSGNLPENKQCSSISGKKRNTSEFQADPIPIIQKSKIDSGSLGASSQAMSDTEHPKEGASSTGTINTQHPKEGASSTGKLNTQHPKEIASSPGEPNTQHPKEGASSTGKLNTQHPKEIASSPGEPNTQHPKEGASSTGKPDNQHPREGASSTSKPDTQHPKEGASSTGKPDAQHPKEGASSTGKPDTQHPKEGASSTGKPDAQHPKEGASSTGKPDAQHPKEGVSTQDKSDTQQSQDVKTGEQNSKSKKNNHPKSNSKKSSMVEVPLQASEPDKALVLTEMNPDETNYCYINIKTLILKDYWAKIETVCLRIGLKYFDKFDTSIVPFHEIQQVLLDNFEFIVIEGRLKYPISLIKRTTGEISFAYKYYLHLTDGNESYEKLFHKYGDFNRFLSIPLDKHNKQELAEKTFHHFDLMILPEKEKEKGRMKGIISFFFSDKNPFLDIAERRLFSLQALLPSFLGYGSLEPCSSMEKFISEFNKLSSELTYFRIIDIEYHYNSPRFWNWSKSDSDKDLIHLIEAWLLINVAPEGNKRQNFQFILYRFYFSCYIIYYYSLKNDDLNLKLVLSLENYLEEILMAKLPPFGDIISKDEKFLFTVQTAIIDFIFKLVMKSKHTEKVIFLLPLYHKIYDLTDIIISLQAEFKYWDNEYWGFPSECVIYSQEGIRKQDIEKAMSMAQYDPILPYSIMVYTMNDNNVALFIDLFKRFPRVFHLSTFLSVILFRLYHAKYYDHKIQQDDKLRQEVIVSLAATLLLEKDKIATQDINRIIKLTIFITEQLPSKFVTSPLFGLILELLFNGVTIAGPETLPISSDESKHLFNEFFMPWIVKNSIMNQMIHYKVFLREIELLDDFLLKYSIPPSLRWDNMIEKVLHDQLKGKIIRVRQQFVIDIFISLHDEKNHSEILQAIFRREMTEGINGVSSDDKQIMIEKLTESLKGTEQLSKVSDIFCKILLDEAKYFKKDPIKHFIKWSAWGTYFQFLNSGDIKAFISETAYVMLISASDQFLTLIDLAYHLQFDINTLKQIFENEDHFINLVDISLNTKREHQINLPYATEDIRVKLRHCKDALYWIKCQKELVLVLHQFLGRCENINHEYFLDFLVLTLEEIPINDLCNFDGAKFIFQKHHNINKIIYFQNISGMVEITLQLMEADIFIQIFDKYLVTKGLKPETPFDIEFIYQEVWIPALQSSVQLIERFMQQSILISEVCEYFRELSDRDHIIQNLKFLDFGCKLFQSQPLSNNNFLIPCVDKIQIYSNLQQCSRAAELIIQLKDALSLSSDFHLIENLIDSKQTFQNKPLLEVTEQISQTATSLGAITRYGLDVIRTFIERIDFIGWVQDNMNDLNDVKTFVDISLTTCGGSPVDIDRITCLSSVCTNFSPLIFQLNKDTPFETLIAKCKEVIASVGKNRELTELLKQVGNSITFWEEMKKSHGSVEETTLMQLDSITRSGEFCIKVGDSLDINDILTVSVKRQDNENKIYSLEHLRELRSKLMLVVSRTGASSHSDSYKNAQHFNLCLDTLTEIVLIVIQLAETGNLRYTKYEFSYSCEKNENILFEEKSNLRSTLEEWQRNVENARNDFYFLNYYTISQIVSLQKGISSFTEHRDNNDVEQLYHLLRLLNHDIAGEDIEQALRMSDFVIRPKLLTASSISMPKQDHSKQSIATVLSTQFSYTKTPHSKFSSSLPPTDLDPSFPDSFTTTEKTIAENMSQKCDFSLFLTIRGINTIKNQGSGLVTEEALMVWCMNNDDDETGSVSCMEDSVSDSGTDLSAISSKNHSQSNLSTDFYKLGKFLEEVYRSSETKLRAERELYYNLDLGEPNLVILPSAKIFEFVLSLYMCDNEKLPLPNYHEVLVCSPHTKQEELEIFWRRVLTISERNDLYLFCLVNIDNLRYEVAVEAVTKFRMHQQGETVNVRYKLVLICSEEKEDMSYMAAAFEDYKKTILTFPKPENIKMFLSRRFSPMHLRATLGSRDPACIVDKDRSRVRLVVSESVGAGKSLYVSNLVSDMLTQGVVSEEEREEADVTVAIHGKQASEDLLTGELLRRRVSCVEHGHLFHVDVASTVQLSLEPILFKLLVLGGVCRRTGELWHCRRNDYYVVELTLNAKLPSLTNFIRLYPIVQCVQPFEAIQTMAGDRNTQTSDVEEMRKEEYQRVYAYLKALEIGSDLDLFSFQLSSPERFSHSETMNIIFKYCGIVKPSWAEVRNFVSFLDKQLSDCDRSDYCVSGVMGQEWKGFKSFVVRFMIHMSRDFATPSLERENLQNDENFLAMFEIIERRKWENNSHPYIFFNPDRHTMTFLGFHISDHGHLVNSDDPTKIIENNIMHPQLLQILTANRVNLQENYSGLAKIQKIVKIASVIGTEWLADPDPGYVLTLDNMRKMLAILMRFRCNIPVIIMGETGCGKTRLIQFMCALQALQTGAKNMLILKVHGGTTEKDVMNKVEEAELLAEENTQLNNKSNSLKIDTVLFFDEANTSPAIGLIKEIMCDKRMYGRKIRTDIGLQFIAACNPYRKHSVEMLDKLSCAGLGFFTEASRTTDRLGDIPLRELVYRVMELPASMRPLVWDFGQLSNSIERTYTREIVAKHLTDRNSPIDASDAVVDVITEVLSSAQNYMRKRKDECSFVSLRDVERAMRVLLWFYSKLDHFRPDEDDAPTDISEDDSSVEGDNLSDNDIELAEPHAHETIELDLPIEQATDHEFLIGPQVPIALDPILDVIEQPFHHPIDHTNLIDFDEMVPAPAELRRLQRREVKSINNIDFITYSLILSLAVCYRARLQERDEFDEHIVRSFNPPLNSLKDHQIISKEVDRCQTILLDEMSVGENIAKNAALKENVFMMFVCIELKIPLFVIGKPGSSKSLAKSIISNSMQGGHSPEGSILKHFKQVQIMSYQCSQLSTADGIISVFRSCRNLQRKTGSNKFVACVVLDEVGLAEDSPLLPLKVLHPLLEDSSYAAQDIEDATDNDDQLQRQVEVMDGGDNDQYFAESNELQNQVAFIGISNWSLDPAKMNRGIMVSRGDPDIDELISSARGICQSEKEKGPIIKSIEKKIPQLAGAYNKLTTLKEHGGKENKREYYGLRDFYSLIKMLVFICNEKHSKLSPDILEHAVRRNFGGVSDVDPVKVFTETVKLAKIDNQGLDSTPLGLIRANLTNLSRSYHGETRYLLLLTENYSALNILLQSPDMWPKKGDIENIRVIFGSSFPSDQEYSAVCRNINNIKVCMESGKTIVLLNLENLYESLYDALNQYYMELNNQRYVDLGLGTHRMKCRVHNDFKLIVIADRETVQERFPTPLINRLEKHFLTMSTVLSEEGVILSEKLTKWAKDFSTLDRTHSFGFQKRCDFSEGDCFIGYHTDTPSSIVFHVMKAMYPEETADYTELDREAVLERSQITLLRMATTDAVLRVKNSFLMDQSDSITKEYFKLQLGSLEEYLRQALGNIYDNDTRKYLTLATTHSRLLTDRDVNQLKEHLKEETNEIKCLSLQQFQSEQQFSSEIQRFLKGESESEERTGPSKRVLLVQCDKGVENAKLIACARHKTVEELSDWREERVNEDGVCLIFLVQLRREAHGSQFESFCGGDWNTVHIDDIRSLDYKELPPISELIGKQIHQIFGGYEDSGSIRNNRIFQWIKLRECIQSAASRLDDSKGSEDRTLSRIRDFSEYITEKDDMCFQILCKRMTYLLREHDEQFDCDWLQLTANCGEDIQSSGTFRKAVNLRINRTITPLLAELIALLDRNGNLELGLLREDVPPCIHDLWQAIFQDERLLVLTYKDIISSTTLKPRVRVPVLSDGAGGKFFLSLFPFSWLIFQITSDLLKESKTMTGIDSENIWIRFESLFDQTPLGECTNQIFLNEENIQYILLYLRDFIYMKLCPRDQFDYGVFEYVILRCISSTQAQDMNERDLLKTTPTIPKIHCAYEDSKHLIELLQQAFHSDGRLGQILYNTICKLKQDKDPRLNCLEHVLLEEIVGLCSHKKELTSSEELAEKYISQIRQFQALMEKGLNFKRQDELYKREQLRIRYTWDRILAVELFIIHCTFGVGLNVTETSINRLFMLLGDCPDFTSAVFVNHILTIISNCLKKIGKASKLKEKFKECATRFFINILTHLTFKFLEEGAPNDELVTMLMGFVTLDEERIAELLTDRASINLFTKDGLDPSPAFRTFLLQLLIKHRPDVFKEQISKYLEDTIYKYGNQATQRDLFLLIIHSIEDSLHQHYKQLNSSVDDQFVFFRTYLDRLPNHPPTRLPISYDLFEYIATLRFLCTCISHWIIQCYQLVQEPTTIELPNPIQIERQRLVSDFKNICLKQGFEDLHVFLLKNIYNQLGSDTIHLITKNQECLWILPESVREKMNELQAIMPDYFIIYGEEYIRITSALEQVCLLQKKDALLQFFNSENEPPVDTLQCLLYSMFQETVKTVKTAQGETQEIYEKFLTLREFLNTELKQLNPDVLNLAMQISSNTLGNKIIPCFLLSSTSEHHDMFLVRLIYHLAVLLTSKRYNKLFSPIAMIYENPASLKDKLFPTMMDDQLLSAKAAMSVETGKWYRCPNGHPYFIGDCGGAVTTNICPDCGSNVGGQDYKLKPKNALLDITKDETKRGYLLGAPADRKNLASGERSLTPASLKVLRALMHATFVWSSCSSHPIERSNALPSLVISNVDNTRDLPNFFYQHLERDVRELAGLIGKNFEEATFILHLIIKSLMQAPGEQCLIPTQLTERELRDQWEKEFDRKFMQPTLNPKDNIVQKQMDQVLNEKRIANNPLLRIVYERDEPEPDNQVPHLWRYRTIVSLEHFSQSFSTAGLEKREKCPIIAKFLKEERSLYVTRYLPDIVQLQRRVGEKFLHRLDRREAASITIGDFLKRLRQENREEADEYGKLIESLDVAWSLIGEEVKVKGRLRMEEFLEQQITPATPLAYLLPSTRGEGLLITSLTDYLLLMHNSFVHAYRDIVKGSRSDKVPLREVTSCHMIEFEDQIQPLLLSHAHYSLALGQGTQISYDFEGVEKQLMEQLIQSKPLIAAEHLRFEYSREAYNLGVFEQVRHKVQQSDLKENLWRAIKEDMNNLEAVSDVLLVLDVVIGFLASAGGEPEQKLFSYLHDVLKYPHASQGTVSLLQSRRAEGVLRLKHVLSFWRFLSLEKARKVSILGQVPFSSLREEFLEEVSEEEIKQLEHSCDYFPVEKVLLYLHDFILFFVRERDIEERNYALKDSVEEYANENEWNLPQGFSKQFPGTVKLSQCATAWAVLARKEDRIIHPEIL